MHCLWLFRSVKLSLLAALLLSLLTTSQSVLAAEEKPSPLRLVDNGYGSFVQASLGLDLFFTTQDNAWYGNDLGMLGTRTNSWWETLVRPGLQGTLVLPNHQTLYGKVDLVLANTFGGIDAEGTNIGLGDVTWTGFDHAYVGWRSGPLFTGLDPDFLDLSFGRQTYVAGTSFVFANEGSAGYRRAAYYLGGRRSADYAAVARMRSGAWLGDLFHFKNNPLSDRHTSASGATLEYAFSPRANLGGTLAMLDSDRLSRDHMRVANLHGSCQPFAAGWGPELLAPLKFEAEFVHEDRDQALDSGFGWYLATSYQWAQLPWKPELTYRFASFDENYDTLFYSATDWGSWFQGEIMGEYDQFSTNLDIHLLRLRVQPVPPVRLSLLYYTFLLHDPQAFGIQSDHYAKEWNLILDWAVNPHLSLSLVGAYAIPEEAAKLCRGGEDNWLATVLYAVIRF